MNNWVFWGIIIFTGATTGLIQLVFPTEIDPILQLMMWAFFSFVGALMFAYGYIQERNNDTM